MPPIPGREKDSGTKTDWVLDPMFLDLTEKQFASSDFDAEHPLWRHLFLTNRMDVQQRLWLSLLYMAFYDEASAWKTYQTTKPFTIPSVENLALPIGRNRRNLFGGRILRHFESMAELKRNDPQWPIAGFTKDRKANWGLLKSALGDVWGNGRFGIYTTAEMLQKVNGMPVEVLGFDHRGSSGPLDGVKRAFGYNGTDFKIVDELTLIVYNTVLESGLKPTYTGVDRGVVESVLCNYGGVCRGCFYSGRNLDRQHDRIKAVENLGAAKIMKTLWEARLAVFPQEFLGEIQGWGGVDKQRLKLYRDKRELPWVDENRKVKLGSIRKS